MYIGTVIRVDATKILSRRELAAVLDDLRRKAPRSANAWMNLNLVRLTCCCGRQPAAALLHPPTLRDQVAAAGGDRGGGDRAAHQTAEKSVARVTTPGFILLPLQISSAYSPPT